MNVVINRDAKKLIKPLMEPSQRIFLKTIERMIRTIGPPDPTAENLRVAFLNMLIQPDSASRYVAMIFTDCILLAAENVKTIEAHQEQLRKQQSTNCTDPTES